MASVYHFEAKGRQQETVHRDIFVQEKKTTVNFSRGAAQQREAAGIGARYGVTASKDWGYPRTSHRQWSNSPQPEKTLTPGLTQFFGNNGRPTITTPFAKGKETELFRQGAQQVEGAVTALSERRRELQRDVDALEVLPRPFLADLLAKVGFVGIAHKQLDT